MKKIILKCIFILNILKYCKSDLPPENQNIIQSFTEELQVKHFSIVQDEDFRPDYQYLHFAKNLSLQNIYTSFLSTSEMYDSMREYYETPGDNYLLKNQLKGSKITKKRETWVYPPKTLVLIHGPNTTNTIERLFTLDNEYSVSKYLWLIFSDGKEIINSKNRYIPYNCQLFIITAKADIFDVMEVYDPSINSSISFIQKFGIWNEKNKELEIFEPNIYERRFNLNGTILRTSPSSGPGDIQGFCYYFIGHFSKIMNFQMMIVPRNKELKNTKFDYEFLPLLNFMTFANFYPFIISPLWEDRINLYIGYDEKYEQHGISPFLRPFSYNLWAAVIAWIITSGTIIIFIGCATKKILASPVVLSDYLYEPLESFLNQCGGETPRKSSLKIMSAASRLAALFLTPAYTGAILSFILTPKIEYPFENIKEFVEDGTYKLGFLASLNGDYLLKKSNDPWIKTAYKNYSESIDGNQGIPFDNAIDKICKDHRFALISFSVGGDKRCKLLKIPSPVFTGWLAIYLRDESPYRNAFNHVLKTFHSNGIVKRFKSFMEELLAPASSNKISDSSNESNSVAIIGMKTVFVITGILYLVSILILTAEICISRISLIFSRLREHKKIRRLAMTF